MKSSERSAPADNAAFLSLEIDAPSPGIFKSIVIGSNVGASTSGIVTAGSVSAISITPTCQLVRFAYD